MSERVKIAPKISLNLKKRLAIYAINTGLTMETVVEMALSQFLQDKDLTPVVQLQLFESIETTYDDPRFQSMKSLITLAHTTTANQKGKEILIKRLNNEYNIMCKVGMCPELKLEYEESLKKLRNEE